MLNRLAHASPAARGTHALGALHDAIAAIGRRADAVPLVAPAAAAAAAARAPKAVRIDAWSNEGWSRVCVSTVDLAPLALRLELVAIPRGPLPTLVMRLEVDSVGIAHWMFDAFGPAAGRPPFASLARAFREAGAAVGDAAGPANVPAWIAALSSGGGIVASRRVDALVHEASRLAIDALALGDAHRHEVRGPAFDASHRTAADALRAHDPLARAVRLRFGAAFAARFDALRFAES